MPASALQIIRDEHAALAAVLRSLGMMMARGPCYDRLFTRIVLTTPAPSGLLRPGQSGPDSDQKGV